MAAVAGMRCAGSEYQLYNADAIVTLKMQLSVFRVSSLVWFLDSTPIKL